MEIIAHRGASYDVPENTLAAARLAWAQGADALELDVQLTRDGELAVAHDEDLRRVAGAARRLDAATLAELKAFDVGRWKGPAFAGEKIPALAEVLATVPAGRRVFIEIKGGPGVVPALGACVAHSGVPPERVAVISFDRLAVRAAKQAMPRCETVWIVDAPGRAGGASIDALLRTLAELELDGLDCEWGWPLDAAFVQGIQRRGFKVYVWTVDDPTVAARLATAGVDGLTTNRPGWLRAQLGQAEPRLRPRTRSGEPPAPLARAGL